MKLTTMKGRLAELEESLSTMIEVNRIENIGEN